MVIAFVWRPCAHVMLVKPPCLEIVAFQADFPHLFSSGNRHAFEIKTNSTQPCRAGT